MGAKNDWSSLKSRVAGKWQIPLLAVALALFAATIYRTRPEIPATPYKEALGNLDGHILAGHFSEAIREARELDARTDLTPLQRPQAELRMGRARFGAARTGSQPNPRVAGQIVKHFKAASPNLESPPLSPDDFVAIGRLMQWQGEHEAAIEQFEKAVELGHPQTTELLKEAYAIFRDRLEAEPSKLAERLDAMVARVEAHRLDVRMWRLEEMFHVADEMGSPAEIEAALAREAADFAESDYWPHFEFLSCRVLAATGREAEAEVRLRALRNQVDELHEVSARAGWLLGTMLLRGETVAEWTEALSFFSNVLQLQPNDPYGVASRVGQGAALARLGRHDEAIATYGKAVKQLGLMAENRVVSLPELRGSLAVTTETLRQQGDLSHAVEYATLAVRLTDQEEPEEKTLYVQPLALLEEQLAEAIAASNRGVAKDTRDTIRDAVSPALPEEAAGLFASSARHFDDLAKWNIHEEPRSADFSWKAAELFARAGAMDEAGLRYRDFVSQRPEDPRRPTALLRVGQLHYVRGQLAAAVEAFQECHQRFPRSFDGARALVPLARAYMAMGPEKFGDAERALRLVLDDSDVFTPAAGDFVEGLFLLGDVLERDARYEPAISTLQEALDRYPNDPRVPRGRFLLGGAYRKSALALRGQAGEAAAASDLERIREEAVHRFVEAREVYRELISELEFRSVAELGDPERMYLQHSYLYEADCFFETQEYTDALRLYEQAAGNLRDSARGLSAHVQMINCQVFLGRKREARSALARAMVVVDALPESAFENRVAPESRGEWKAYFEWLGESELF